MMMMPVPLSLRPLQVLIQPSCFRFLVVVALLFTLTTTTTTTTLTTANAQQQEQPKRYEPKKRDFPKTTYGDFKAKKLQAIGDVLFMVLDNDKNGEVTMKEVKDTIEMLQQLFDQAPPTTNDEETVDYRSMLDSFKKVAPQLFKLLDANEDGKLKHWEFKFVTKFERSFQKGGDMKQLLRDVFAIVDFDGNDEISKTEWQMADLDQISDAVHTLFPLRPTAEEFHTVFMTLVTSSPARSGANIDVHEVGEEYYLSRPLFSHIDTNRDGKLSRGEVSIAYNKFGREVLEMAKEIKTMGPTLAMFNSMGGGAGSRDEF